MTEKGYIVGREALIASFTRFSGCFSLFRASIDADRKHCQLNNEVLTPSARFRSFITDTMSNVGGLGQNLSRPRGSVSLSYFPAHYSFKLSPLLSLLPSVFTRWAFPFIIPIHSLSPYAIIDIMPRITCFFFSLAYVSLAATQSYTSLEDMPAWKTLPPGASNAVIIAESLYYAGCVTSVPQISTAACYETLPAMSSSLLSNIVHS